jgi:CHAD domain-containing protein
MKFYLGKIESPSEGLARINRELCERAHRAIKSGSVPTDSTIFELRKVVKKLRAILRVSRRAIDKKSFRELDRLMRAFGKDLGRPRDGIVLIDTLDALLEHFSPFSREPENQPARDALFCRYQAALDVFLQHNDELSLASRFHDIERRISNLDLQRVSRPKLLTGINKTYRRCRTSLERLRAEPSTENSHELRRQVEYTWNQLRLIRKRDPGKSKPMITGLDRLGRLLGEDSDIAMLVETLQRHPEICCNRIRCEFIIALAEARRIALLSASLRLADRLFSETPKDFSKWLNTGAGKSRV